MDTVLFDTERSLIGTFEDGSEPPEATLKCGNEPASEKLDASSVSSVERAALAANMGRPFRFACSRRDLLWWAGERRGLTAISLALAREH